MRNNRFLNKVFSLLLLFISFASSCLCAEAEIGSDSSGRPVLVVGGAPMPLLPGLTGFGSGDGKEMTAFRQAGLKAVVVFANLGFYQSKLGYVAPIKHMREFWRGPGDYDKTDVDKILSQPLKVNPDFKIILWLAIGEYPEFGFKYPDEVIRNDKGEALIASTHFLRFDSAPPRAKPGQAEHYAISFFSERYRKECSEMLVEFIKTVEASPHGKNVIGYLIGGGQDCQLYSWSPPDGFLQDKPENWGDYSPAAKKSFIKWIENKYGDITTLNQAWNSTLTSFEQATPPAGVELAGTAPFHDMVKERRAYDWKRFLAEGRAELLDCFAGAIKSASNKKIIVGASGGDGGHRRDNTSISRLLRSNNLDFFLHQASYGVRIPPSAGGINALLDSYTVNGKLFLTDMDHRLWTGGKKAGETVGVVSFTDVSVGRAADMTMQRDMWRREYARLWISGNNGAWFNNMGPGFEYENAGIQDEMRFLNDFSTKLIERRRASSLTRSLQNIFTSPEPVATAEVAFIFDEEAVDYARGALGEFHGAGMYAQWNEANVSGVPIRYYYAQDLRDCKIPPAKLYVFQNIIDIDVKLAERIKEIRKDGATIVLLQGTGMAQLLRGQEKYLDDLLGIKLRPLDTAVKPASAISKVDTAHPLLKGSEWNYKTPSLSYEKIKEVKGISLTVEDNNVAVLADYPVAGLPAAAVKDDSRVIFIGAYTLSRDLISRLAAYAGAWRVSPHGNAIAADTEILMIHPLKSGKIDIVLKEPASLMEIQPGKITSAKAIKHTLDLKAGQTCLFEQQR